MAQSEADRDRCLERPQGRVRRHGPHFAELYRAGWSHSANRTAASYERNRPAAAAIRASGRERLSRGRRQPASTGALRSPIEGQEETALDLSYRILQLCVTAAAPSPVSMASARKSRKHWATCSPNPTSTPCNWFAAPSIRRTSRNPDKVFPRPPCAEKPGPIQPHPLETAGIAEIF